MIEGKTSCGFAYQIEETAFDDMELVDAIADLEENPAEISKIIRLMLGDEQKKALYEKVRTPEGRVPVKAVMQAVEEIFSAKNSTVKK